MEVFRKYLEEAGYPASWIKDTPMEDILSTPGIKRLYTLKWCLSKFDLNIEKRLDVQEGALEAALWETLTKILGICTDGKKDRQVFEGKGKLTDQIEFWKKIFHLVKLTQLKEQPCAIEHQTDHNILEQFKPEEPLNLIPMEMKMASSDVQTSSDQLIDLQKEVTHEVELVMARNDNGLLEPLSTDASETIDDGAPPPSTSDDLELLQEDLQNSLATFTGIYESKLELLVEQTEPGRMPSACNAEAFCGAASRLLTKLSEVNAIHEHFLKLRNEYVQFMRQKTNSLRATLENGENKLRELRMMVSALEDLEVQ